jgi:AcrR family transcriptional regulator
MSGNERPKMRKGSTRGRQIKRKPDKRARRTHERLGMALLELMVEKPIDEVTVQEVLDRASVGRSTFYLHFRDKNDLLLSQLEVFLATMSNWLSLRGEKSHRVVPVEEMFAHIGGQNKIWRALVDCGRLQDFLDLAQGYFARGIERRLKESNRVSKLPQPELAAHAVALAGSLLSLLRWWIDRGAKDSPRDLDKIFHRMVWNGLQASADSPGLLAQRTH